MTIRHALFARLTAALALSALAACSGTRILNALTPSGGYGIATNIVFDAAHGLALDIYKPSGAKDAPVIVFFYGGRWTEGRKDDFKFAAQALASKGFVAVLPDYRHYPAVKFPAFVQDAARAVQWTFQRIRGYGGDPAKVFVMGHSSGAHLAAMLALNPAFLKEAGGDRTQLRGMIGLSGPYDFIPITAPDMRDMFGPPERFELSQPITFVDGENPPLLLLHGEDDSVVGSRNTKNLAAAVAKAGGVVETVLYPEMSHAWMVATLAATLRGQSDVLQQVADFVRRKSVETPKESSVKTVPGEP